MKMVCSPAPIVSDATRTLPSNLSGVMDIMTSTGKPAAVSLDASSPFDILYIHHFLFRSFLSILLQLIAIIIIFVAIFFNKSIFTLFDKLYIV